MPLWEKLVDHPASSWYAVDGRLAQGGCTFTSPVARLRGRLVFGGKSHADGCGQAKGGVTVDVVKLLLFVAVYVGLGLVAALTHSRDMFLLLVFCLPLAINKLRRPQGRKKA